MDARGYTRACTRTHLLGQAEIWRDSFCSARAAAGVRQHRTVLALFLDIK